MTIKCTTSLRNAVVVALKTALDGGKIYIYSGSMPTNPEDPIWNSDLLCVISKDSGVDGLTFAPSSSNGAVVKSPDEIWAGDILMDGTPTFWRWGLDGEDVTVQSDTYLRMQGTVGIAGADLNFSTVDFIQGENRSIDFAQFLLINL
jgi:hypothetical protein